MGDLKPTRTPTKFVLGRDRWLSVYRWVDRNEELIDRHGFSIASRMSCRTRAALRSCNGVSGDDWSYAAIAITPNVVRYFYDAWVERNRSSQRRLFDDV